MATERDTEYTQMILNAPGPSTSQSAGRGAQIAESYEKLPKQRIEVTVVRAVNVPSMKKYSFLKRKLYAAVSNAETTAKTADVRVERQMAQWNQNLAPFLVQPSSNLTLRLYAKRSAHPDVLIGTHEMQIPLASQSDIPCVLENDAGKNAQSTQPVTLYITVDITPPTLYNSPPSIPTADDSSPAEETPTPGRIQLPSPEHQSPLSHHQPVETGMAMPQSRKKVSPTSTKVLRSALRQTDKAMKQIEGSDTCEMAVRRIKWVMDTLGPIAEHFALAKIAHSLLSAIPKTLLEQYQRDDNVQTLLRAIHHAFDFTRHEDTLLLKSIKPKSEQARILTVMLQDVGTCCDFIQSYLKYPEFWKRTLTNIGGGADKKIKELSNRLVGHRKAFLDQATISAQITAFKILDGVGNISTQLQDLSSQHLRAEIDAKIREIPRADNSRFSSNKGCLAGTRVAFLDFIIDWVNDPNPNSERGLLLFGQAGTGKSSIAHEIARLFDKMNLLTSSFIFSRSEQSDRKAPYHLFTTLAHHLADRYPSFKTALGNVVKDNADLRGGTHDYLLQEKPPLLTSSG